MKSAELFGYKVFENGTIIGKKGKKISKRPQIKVYFEENQKPTEMSYARFVYYAFNQDSFNYEDKSIVISFKDKNRKNFKLNNLIAVNKKNIYQGQNHTKSKLTDKEVEEIRRLYNKNKNKRDGEHDPFAKISYRKLADKYGVSHTLIKGIVKGNLRNKDNYIMK